MKYKIGCKTCGKQFSEHHRYEPDLPEDISGCKCDAYAWMFEGDNIVINAICDDYQGDGIVCCQQCGHEKYCHKGGTK